MLPALRGWDGPPAGARTSRARSAPSPRTARRGRGSRSTSRARRWGDPEMLRTIERDLRATGLDPSRVITETAAIANIGKAREFADEVARLG